MRRVWGIARGAAAALLCLMVAGTAGAADLYSIYQEALGNDPDLASAAAANDAMQEEYYKGRAGLLPNVSLSGVETKNHTTQRGLTFLGMRSQDLDYTSSNYGLSMHQPIYRPANWATYQQGKSRVSYGEAVFANAKQDLIVRASGAYLDVLLAQDTLSLLAAQKTALAEQLAQAKQTYARGEGTITDVNDAQARYDLIQAQEIEGLNNYDVARRSLERIIGREPDPLNGLGAGSPPPVNPDPNDIQQWVKWAQDNNPNIQAQRFAVDVASQEIAKARSDHKPTVDFIASRSKTQSENNVSINTKYDTVAMGVQVAIPLFAGGYVSANVRQAEAKLRQAQQDQESSVRKVTLDTRQNYLSVVNGAAQIKAYEHAVASNEAALVSTRKSAQGGLRTTLDVLNAEQQVYASKRDLAKARYTYVISWLKLKADVGTLGEDDVKFVNHWMSAQPASVR